MSPETRRRIAELEAQKPSPETNPTEFARFNQEISRLIDEDRAFKKAASGFKVA